MHGTDQGRYIVTKTTVSGTREWAATSANVMQGCSHDCRYCYARSRASQIESPWVNESVQPNLLAKEFGKRKGTVMFPTQHDITPENLPYTGEILRRLLAAGNNVLVVTKPHREVVMELCALFGEYKGQILFRFTIGSRNDRTLSLWEPGAPGYQERLSALKYARNSGFATGVSMEPILDTDEDHIVSTFYELLPFVTDAIWLGKMNRVIERLTANGFNEDEELMDAATMLMASQSDERIAKLYARLMDEPKVKWKESIKIVVGIAVPTEAGLDV